MKQITQPHTIVIEENTDQHQDKKVMPKKFYCQNCGEQLGTGILINLLVMCPVCEMIVVVNNKKLKTYGKGKLTVDQMFSKQSDAKTNGHNHYYTGIPCRRGHLAPRYVKSKACVECSRTYYQRNQEKHKPPKRASLEKAKRWYQIEVDETIEYYGVDGLTIKDMWSQRTDAQRDGHSHYFTGKPCRSGHLSPRQTSNATCVQCARDHSDKYQKKHEQSKN